MSSILTKGVIRNGRVEVAEPIDLPDGSEVTISSDVHGRVIGDFLNEVYSLASLNDPDGATDRIFDFIDRLLCDGKFGICDEILAAVEVEKLPTTLMSSFLTITAAAKEKLPSRPMLYQKIEQKMIELRGAEKTQKILRNLA